MIFAWHCTQCFIYDICFFVCVFTICLWRNVLLLSFSIRQSDLLKDRPVRGTARIRAWLIWFWWWCPLCHARLPCSQIFSFTAKLTKKNVLQCQHKCNFKIFFHWFLKCFAYNIINSCIPIVFSTIRTFAFSFLSGPC